MMGGGHRKVRRSPLYCWLRRPVQFTTSEIGVSGGGAFPPSTEAAIMATIEALTQPTAPLTTARPLPSFSGCCQLLLQASRRCAENIRTRIVPEFLCPQFCGDIDFGKSTERVVHASSLAIKSHETVLRFLLWVSRVNVLPGSRGIHQCL